MNKEEKGILGNNVPWVPNLLRCADSLYSFGEHGPRGLCDQGRAGSQILRGSCPLSPSLPLPPSSLSPPRLVSGPSLIPDKLSLFYGKMRKRYHTLWQYGISPKGLLSCREIQQKTLGLPWWC